MNGKTIWFYGLKKYGSYDHCKNIRYIWYENQSYVIVSRLTLHTCLFFKSNLKYCLDVYI